MLNNVQSWVILSREPEAWLVGSVDLSVDLSVRVFYAGLDSAKTALKPVDERVCAVHLRSA